MADSESPLIKALPPESDYLTYLTIIEYNLTLENLPVLHQVLQDETLTSNIGWDLVHLLVPFIPESEPCLQDVARLGNPREVILKVTESLRLLEYDIDDDSNNILARDSEFKEDTTAGADLSTDPHSTLPTGNEEQQTDASNAIELPPPPPQAVTQFMVLVALLVVLHQRIKTKYPSRFLSTTLQAILASFSKSTSHREEMIVSVAKFVKAVTGSRRPPLPNRQSSGVVHALTAQSATTPAGDPEALADTTISPEEIALQQKLLQSFVTHILAEYMLNFNLTQHDLPGMAWSSRIMEKLHPDRIIPHNETFTALFQADAIAQRRIDGLGQLVALARELKLTDEELLKAAKTAEKVPLSEQDDGEDDPPNSAEEIELSRLGSLILLAARKASVVLHDTTSGVPSPQLAIFPDHYDIMRNCLASSAAASEYLGSEPEALLDAVHALGLLCLEADSIGDPKTENEFNDYLRFMALLSANCPSPSLRGHAHYLTSTVLRSQPDADLRLAFIRDTLEHCPFENLKVSAVGWIKGETIEANPPTGIDEPHNSERVDEQQKSVFSTPVALNSLAPFLFPDLQAELNVGPVHETYIDFRNNLSFYFATLNFLYLLLSTRHLHNTLLIPSLWTNSDISGGFLQQLRDASSRYRKSLDRDGELGEEATPETSAELNLLDEALERVTVAATSLGS